ncbi:MAG TPA: SRPBCC family protein [Rudaea sp.]|nr:SRPBCC family protein [Rudaea sp.]
MIVHLHTERLMHAAPEAVYALSLDPVRFPATFAGFGPIPGLRRITPHGPPEVGATRDVEDLGGVVMCERIEALEPGRRHAYALSGLKPPLSWLVREGRADWRFLPDAVGTRVTWSYAFELTSPVAAVLATPLLRVFMRGAMQRCLDVMATQLGGEQC